MGIPGFNSWFQQRNRSAYVPLNTIKVDHVYVDLNSILHNALRTGKTWEKFHKRLHAKLNGLLEVMQPQKTVMLAVDGPAPLAKLLTQRSRRKKSGGKSEKGSKELSGNAITPGTKFMADVTLSLTAWVAMKLQSRKWQHLQFELSDGTVMGEGEVKILGRLARHWHRHSPDDTHMIVGDDADLVLMACVSWREHLFVANSAMTDEKNLHRGMKVFSVDELHTLWLSKLHPSHSQLPLADDMKLLGMKMDLALLAILCSGNDYLPGLRGIRLEDLWREYLKQRKQQAGVGLAICSVSDPCSSPRINLANLVQLIKVSGVHVPAARQTSLTAGNSKSAGGDGNSGGADNSNSSGSGAGNSSGGAGNSEATSVTGVAANGTDDEDAGTDEGGGYSLAANSEEYLHGLAWVMHMYLQGHCPDYRFTYDRAAPSVSEFAAALQAKAATTPEVCHDNWAPVPAANLTPLPPVGCALAMLPGSSADLLPDVVQPLMRAGPDSRLGDLYETCDQCEEHRVACSIAVSQRASAQQRVEALSAALKGALEHHVGEDGEGALGVTPLQAELAEAQADFDAKKRANIAAIRAREAHMESAHPYKPFPLNRVAAAVQAINTQGMPAEEKVLMRFGTPVVLGLQQGTLSRGTRLPTLPMPFANNRYTPYRPLSCMALAESLSPDAARLAPDTQFAPSLPDHYISAPPDLPLEPAQRGAAPGMRGAGPAERSRMPGNARVPGMAPRYAPAPARTAGPAYAEAPVGGSSSSGMQVDPVSLQPMQGAVVEVSAAVAASSTAMEVDTGVVVGSSEMVGSSMVMVGGVGVDGQQFTWQQQLSMRTARRGRAAPQGGGQHQRQPQLPRQQQQQQRRPRGDGTWGQEPQLQQQQQRGNSQQQQRVDNQQQQVGAAAARAGGALTWQQQEQQRQQQRRRPQQAARGAAPDTSVADGGMQGTWWQQQQSDAGLPANTDNVLTWQQQEQQQLLQARGGGRGRGRGRGGRGGAGRHQAVASGSGPGGFEDYSAQGMMDVDGAAAPETGVPALGDGAQPRRRHSKRPASNGPANGTNPGMPPSPRHPSQPAVVSSAMMGASTAGRAAGPGARGAALGPGHGVGPAPARPALLPGLVASPPTGSAAPVRRQHIRWP